jgi:hypothetical protein
VYLAMLEAAGLVDARVLNATGYKTSRFTAAYLITANKP